jgi:hypothetical protein
MEPSSLTSLEALLLWRLSRKRVGARSLALSFSSNLSCETLTDRLNSRATSATEPSIVSACSFSYEPRTLVAVSAMLSRYDVQYILTCCCLSHHLISAVGWDTFDEATKLKKRAIELNQGRAAQMGILALMVHEKLGVPIIVSRSVAFLGSFDCKARLLTPFVFIYVQPHA